MRVHSPFFTPAKTKRCAWVALLKRAKANDANPAHEYD